MEYGVDLRSTCDHRLRRPGKCQSDVEQVEPSTSVTVGHQPFSPGLWISASAPLQLVSNLVLTSSQRFVTL
jgi:hypothetical protein